MKDSLSFLEQLAEGYAELARIPAVQYEYNARKCVYEYDKIKLFHYQPKVKKPNSTPVLIVFATVNRPEILDLFPDNSFIGGLLENGLDVYLLDWGYPDEEDNDVNFSDYVTNYLHQCVQFMIEKSQKNKINMIGICQGGVISLCYAALFSHIKNLVLISVPINFKTRDNVISHLLQKINSENIPGVNGNVSGVWLTQFFILMRPFQLIGKKYLHFIEQLSDHERTEKFLRVEKWLHDAPDQTGASFTELVTDLYQNNKLIKGEFTLNGRKIDLSTLTLPILNVMASEDEIIPMSASRSLKKLISSADYTQKIFPSGHIGIYISEKVGKSMPKEIAKWFKKRE